MKNQERVQHPAHCIFASGNEDVDGETTEGTVTSGVATAECGSVDDWP